MKSRFTILALALLACSLCFAQSSVSDLKTGDPAVDDWVKYHNKDGTPKPLDDTRDTSVWPNTKSKANSDEWIVKNHDNLRLMKPRLLVLNFSNQVEPLKPLTLTSKLIAALKESSRYHGYKDKSAPAFLEYSVWKYIDLRDPRRKEKNSRRSPVKNIDGDRMNCDYDQFFSERFAEYYGVRDPKDKNRFLRLDELLDRGYVHEVWFTAAASGDFRTLESIELKPMYDENFKRIPGKYAQAGNGGDDDQKWRGRSVRINSINHDRGIGCAMENLGHSMEGMAHSGCIPYFKKYFYEYAMFDLDTKYKESGMPHNSFYPLWGENKGVSYPNSTTAVVKDGDKTWTINNFVATGGNVHWAPNGRSHYDKKNTDPVMSTIEDWRIGSGPGGKDVAKPFTNEAFLPYESLADDCMGSWLVYWRQNLPSFQNKSKDDNGKPMKNWLVFLFY